MPMQTTYDNSNFIYKYNLKYPDEPETLESAILLMKDLDFDDGIDDMESLRYVSHLLRDNNVIPTHIERAIQLYPNPLNKEVVKSLVARQLREAEAYIKELENYKHTDEFHYSDKDRDKVENKDMVDKEIDKIKETLESGKEKQKNILDPSLPIGGSTSLQYNIENIGDQETKNLPASEAYKVEDVVPPGKEALPVTDNDGEALVDFQEGRKVLSSGPRTIRNEVIDKSVEVKEPEIPVTEVYNKKMNHIINELARTRIRNNIIIPKINKNT